MGGPPRPSASPFRTADGSSPDPFDLGLEALPGTRSTEEAASLAQELSVRIGEHSPVIDVYLLSLSKVPADHLRILHMGGTRIVFAPTIAAALESGWAVERRGRPLTGAEITTARTIYSRESKTAAIYEPTLDILIFPTTWTSRAVDQVVIHEVGHALTYHMAEARPGLLSGLPPSLAQHVRNPEYDADTAEDTLRRRCLEALAEAYVYLVTGREGELPPTLLSELIFILTAVAEGDDKIRIDFKDTDEPTALRVPPESLVGHEHPTLGWLFTNAENAREPLEARELATDELSRRRVRRRAS